MEIFQNDPSHQVQKIKLPKSGTGIKQNHIGLHIKSQ